MNQTAVHAAATLYLCGRNHRFLVPGPHLRDGESKRVLVRMASLDRDGGGGRVLGGWP